MTTRRPINFATPAEGRRGRSASVLIIVMWIAFGVVSLALYFAHSMEMELLAADTKVASIEANQAIEAAAVYASNIFMNLAQPDMIPNPANYHPAAVKVGNGMFWFIGRDTNDPAITSRTGEPTWGFVDEASKANINSTLYNNYTNMLGNLPQMTLNLVAAEYDWHTTNTSPSPGGAKNETYSTLNPAYQCKLTNFETIDELSMVYGMNMDILYGEDANLNGTLDPNENDGDKLPPHDNQDGNLDPGILEYVTVYTKEPTNFGTTNRFTIAGATQTAISSWLSTNGLSSQASKIAANFAATPPNSVLDFYCRSGMQESDFIPIEPFLMNSNLVGLININTASATVLSTLPGIGYQNAPSIVSFRQGVASRLNSIAWFKDALNNNTQQIQLIGPWITSHSYQFSADVAAVGHYGRGYRRVRFVFDLSSGVPLIVYRQDLTYLGWALGKKLHDQLLTGTFKS